MDPIIEKAIRGVIVMAAIYVLFLLLKGIGLLFRAAKRLTLTNIARTAGQASAAAEKRAAELTEAFKQGRKQ